MKRHLWIYILLNLFFLNLAFASTITLNGTLRDFYDYSKDNSKNPDFENPSFPPPSGFGSYAVTKLVKKNLDSDKKPVLKNNNGKGRFTDSSGNKIGPKYKSIKNKTSFSQWYRDVAGINQSMPYSIELTKMGGVYKYENSSFFPLDGLLLGNEGPYYGHDHNYHFTYEIHSSFTYQGGETFTFSGDDDVWVFIDGKLAIDIGGIHSTVTRSVNLDTLGLTVGDVYDFDFFFAERHITGSNFKITTSIELAPQVGGKISGTVFEDISADGLGDGDSNLNDTSGDQRSKSSVDIYLYEDTNSNSQLDASDVLKDTNSTNGDGEYNFSVSNGKYFVVVDSKTVTQTYNSGYSINDVWAEQTYSSDGGFCSDGSGGTLSLAADGGCYGGRRGNWDDDASSLTTAEHVTLVDINDTNASGVDFGFSFNGVTNNEDYGQGSLRQFIDNANAISGANSMRFVPSVAINESSWWSIKLTSALANIVDDSTTIDGRAYNFDGTIRDENNGTIGASVKLGTGADGVTDSGDEPTLTLFDKPELEIIIDSGEQFGFKIFAHDINITNISLYGASGLSTDIYDENNGNIFVESGENTNNIVIENNFIGVRADGSVPTSKSSAYGINFYDSKSIDFSIYHNYISSVGKGGIYMAGSNISNGTISQNEVQKVDWFGKRDDGIAIESGVKNVEVFENYIHDNDGSGIDSYNGGTDNSWYNNTIYNNGHGSSSTEFFGVRLVGSPGQAYQNHIYNNKEAGVLIQGTSTSGQKVSKNSIYNNGTISIDLDVTNDFIDGDGITVNNGSKNAFKPNLDMDFPIFTTAIVGGSTLHVEGYVGSAPSQSIFAGATIEIFKVDDDGDGNGEGRWYLGSCTSDANANIDCNITTSTVSVFDGDQITATAIDTSNNTSGFGENFTVTDSVPLGCEQTAMILNDTKNIYEFHVIDGNETAFTGLDKYTNAIGYNEVDGFVWGYNNEDRNQTLVRISKDLNGSYQSRLFGPIVGAGSNPALPLSTYINVGDIDKSGHLYLLSDTDKKSLYIVDLNSSSTDYLKVINYFTISDSGNGLDISDWAFHPNNGKLYSVNDNGRFYEINPSTGAVNASDIITGLDSNSSYDVFFDDNGYMYAYGAQVGKVFRIDLTDPNNPVPASLLFSTFTSGAGGDSARCASASMGDVPILVIDDVTHTEGHSGTKDYEFTVTLDRPALLGTGFWRTVTDGSDNPPDTNYGEAVFDVVDDSKSDMTNDYGTYLGADFETVPTGDKSYKFIVKINGDTDIEDDERFFVDIYASSLSYILYDRGEAIILNDDYNIELRAVDTSANVDFNDTIDTKIVNKDFDLSVIAYNHTLGEFVEDMNITRIDYNSNLLWNGLQVTDVNGKVDIASNSVSTAVSDTSLKIYGRYNERDYNSSSSDRFAVRPDRYSITVPSTAQVAGEEFNITIKALDIDGNPSIGYNESNSSFRIDYKESDSVNCQKGELTFSSLTFVNGVASRGMKYSEVASMDLNISEIDGSEFAKIDGNNSSLITFDQSTVSFVPDSFDVNWTLGRSANSPVLFYADENSVKNMGAEIGVDIKAINKDGNITLNYKAGCASKDTTLTLPLSVNSASTQTLVWGDLNNNITGTDNNFTDGDNFTFDVNASAYSDGEANASINVNFSRAKNRVKNPMRFSMSEVSALDIDGVSGISTKTVSPLDFYYGRLHSPNLAVEGADMNATIFYEVYCNGCNVSMFTFANGYESLDSINWYILNGIDSDVSAFSNARGAFGGSSMVLGTGSSIITLVAPSLPYADRIKYDPEPWLIYNRFNNSAGSHSFNGRFLSLGATWAGKGKQGMTVDENVSVRKYKKMDW